MLVLNNPQRETSPPKKRILISFLKKQKQKQKEWIIQTNSSSESSTFISDSKTSLLNSIELCAVSHIHRKIVGMVASLSGSEKPPASKILTYSKVFPQKNVIEIIRKGYKYKGGAV